MEARATRVDGDPVSSGDIKMSLSLAWQQPKRLGAGRKVSNKWQERRAPLLIEIGEEQTPQLM